MAKIILFGGGDGGGIRITDKGIEPIPPWDPSLRRQLRALNDLVLAAHHSAPRRKAGRLEDVLVALTEQVLSQVEQLVGAIDGEHGLIYQSDDDGGFTCGSSGRPPLPFPWPVNPLASVYDLLDRGVLDHETLGFLEQAAAQQLDVFAVAADPAGAARELGVTLSPAVERGLAVLADAGDQLEDPVDREVVEFYRRVVTDGRFLPDWAVDPGTVARKLELEVSPEALERIRVTRDAGIRGRLGGEVMSPAAVAVAVAVVIVLWTREMDLPVLDRSGLQKL